MGNKKLTQSQFNELEMNKNFKDTNAMKDKLTDFKQDKFIYASYGRRILSNIIDGAIILLLFLGCGLMGLFYKTSQNVGFVIFIVIAIIYYCASMSSRLQATMGKKICGIKVVNKNGLSLSIWMVVARLLIAMSFYAIALVVFTIPLIYLIDYAAKIGIESAMFEVFGLPILLVVDLGLVYFFFGLLNKNRTFYDKLSKSHVVID